MTRVAYLHLPLLPIERLLRPSPAFARPEPRGRPSPPVDDDPGACSAPRDGHWRPGARWSRERLADGGASPPLHQRPPARELGRRSEAARPPFAGPAAAVASGSAAVGPAACAAAAAPPPLVLVAPDARREDVTAVCPAARALGLTPGMAATHARAMVPGLDVRPADPDADLAWLRRVALHAVRHWTPVAAPAPPDGVWLDLTGSTHLFGGEERFCRRVVRWCGRLGLTGRIALAGTPGAAVALARHGRRPIAIVPPGGDVQAAAGLPLGALRLERDALAAAARFGFETIADLLAVPRGPLARRLGLAAVGRLDQLTGHVAEPIVPIVPFEPPVAERRLLEPIGTADQIALVLADAMTDLVQRLERRGLGVRSLELLMARVDGADQRLVVGTSRATRDGTHLLRLLLLKIDRIEPGLGLESARLTARRAEPLSPVAVGLLDDGGGGDVARIVDRLTGRVGSGSVFGLAPVESDVPERAVARVGPLAEPGGWPSWPRPVRLLARPEPLDRVMALLPDAPPRRFTWRGDVHVVVAGDGPERIHGEWWRRDGERDAVRDYFRVEDDAGARFWLFRRGDGVDPRTGDLSWHVHGVFG